MPIFFLLALIVTLVGIGIPVHRAQKQQPPTTRDAGIFVLCLVLAVCFNFAGWVTA